jgi:hypothetical protein
VIQRLPVVRRRPAPLAGCRQSSMEAQPRVLLQEAVANAVR